MTVVLIAGVCCPAYAQEIALGAAEDSAIRTFEGEAAAPSLSCEVEPSKPVLNFALRLQAGYTVNIPMKQLSGDGHRLNLVLRLSPERKRPVYLTDAIDLPHVPVTGSSYQLKGRYILGEGRYAASLLLRDERGQLCRKEWQIHATVGRRGRSFPLEMSPGSVEEVSWYGRSRAEEGPDASGPAHLTVLLHAAPLGHSQGAASVLGPDDQERLLGAITALKQQFTSASVRIVVFSIDKRKEILRRDDGEPGAVADVADALKQVKLGTVDFRALQNPKGKLDLLAGLMRGEMGRDPRPDAVIFVGEKQRYAAKIAQFEETPPGSPPFFYFQYVSPLSVLALLKDRSEPRVEQDEIEEDGCRSDVENPPETTLGDIPFVAAPDIISRIIEKVNGKIMVIHSPIDLAKALMEVRRRIEHASVQ